jgi:hypothetical protein
VPRERASMAQCCSPPSTVTSAPDPQKARLAATFAGRGWNCALAAFAYAAAGHDTATNRVRSGVLV